MSSLIRQFGVQALVKEKELGQLRPANSTAASLYSPPADITSTEIKSIVVCNTSGASAKYRIFLDSDGTTYDQTTALFYDIAILGDATHLLELNGLAMNNSSGNIAVRTDTASALTFSTHGVECTHVN